MEKGWFYWKVFGKQCKECHGLGKVYCPNCRAGKIRCKECNGSGKVQYKIAYHHTVEDIKNMHLAEVVKLVQKIEHWRDLKSQKNVDSWTANEMAELDEMDNKDKKDLITIRKLRPDIRKANVTCSNCKKEYPLKSATWCEHCKKWICRDCGDSNWGFTCPLCENDL